MCRYEIVVGIHMPRPDADYLDDKTRYTVRHLMADGSGELAGTASLRAAARIAALIEQLENELPGCRIRTLHLRRG